jgi:hypothetical protein
MIHGCKAEFISDKRENFFLVAYEDGYGGVVAPIYDPLLIAKGDMTQYYLSDGTSVLDILS